MTTPPASPDLPPPSTVDLDLGRAYASRRRKIIKITSITLAALLVIVVGGVAADYFYLHGRISVDPYALPSGAKRPPKVATKAENFVLIGSDTRAGASGDGTGAADVAGARSDTTIIMHISANNSGATLISIPRDSYVQVPSCVLNAQGATSAPFMGKFNAAFSIGGTDSPKYAASCTVHTIETLTGIHIDHYAVVDFAGFKSMVSALGGVRMCVAKPLDDPIVGNHEVGFHGSGLMLPAGKSVEIDGQQALDLMRARYALDGGGDLPRIKRQQQFIGAMIRKATSTSLLTNPFRLQKFLVAATGSLTTDGFGVGTMKKLAGALHNVGAGGVRLLTVPNYVDGPGPLYGDVQWDPTQAAALWQSVIHDQPIPGTSPKASPSPSPTSTKKAPALSVPPADISVTVENGTSQDGLAQTVASQLETQGFHVISVGDASTENYTSTTIEYGSEKMQSAETVKQSIPGSVRQAESTSPTSITVIVGSDFTKVVPVTIGSAATPTPTPTPTIASISAANKSCLS